MKNTDKELDKAANRMLKGKAPKAKAKDKEPTDAIGWLKKAANYKFPKTHPHAYMTFSRINFTTPQIGAMAALVDLKKMDHKDAAKKWLKDNKAVWKPWTKAGM